MQIIPIAPIIAAPVKTPHPIGFEINATTANPIHKPPIISNNSSLKLSKELFIQLTILLVLFRMFSPNFTVESVIGS